MASLFSKDPYVPQWRPPVQVNPLIRASRWAALIVGVAYGYRRQEALRGPAQCERDNYEARKCLVDADMAQKKKIANEAEMIKLAKDAGIGVKNC